MLILKALRRESDPRVGVQALGGDAKTVRGCVAANTRENSMEVHYMSITFLLAFEWNRKSLKLLEVRVRFPPCHDPVGVNATRKYEAPSYRSYRTEVLTIRQWWFYSCLTLCDTICSITLEEADMTIIGGFRTERGGFGCLSKRSQVGI